MATTPDIGPRYHLTLFVSGVSPRSRTAIENIHRLLAGPLAERVDLEIVDVNSAPSRVIQDQVLAVPTLVKRLPGPPRQFVGDLSRTDATTLALHLGIDTELGAAPDHEDEEQPTRPAPN